MRRLLLFYALACGISWACWLPTLAVPAVTTPLLVLGTFGPAIATLICADRRGGRRSPLRSLRSARWRVPGRLYAAALLGPLALAILAALIDGALGGPGLTLGRQVPAGIAPWAVALLLLPIFLTGLVFGGPLGEEIGWRGHALPRLLAERGAWAASLILGLAWAAWHWPLFLVGGSSQSAMPPALFVLWVVGLAYLLTRLHLASGGSVPLAIIAHAAINFGAGLLVLPTAAFPATRPFAILAALIWLACGLFTVAAPPRPPLPDAPARRRPGAMAGEPAEHAGRVVSVAPPHAR